MFYSIPILLLMFMEIEQQVTSLTVPSNVRKVNELMKLSRSDHRQFQQRSTFSRLDSSSQKHKSDESSVVVNSTTKDSWNPSSRNLVGVLSTIGAVETGYLTYLHFFNQEGMMSHFCGVTDGSSSCSSVLDSSYASLQIGNVDVPFTLIGFFTYSIVALLTGYPQLRNDGVDGTDGTTQNYFDGDMIRLVIIILTTSMATFSSYLLSLLFNVLKQPCPFCILSATISITIVFLTWTSGALPIGRKQDGVNLGIFSFVATTIASLALFLNVEQKVYSEGYDNNVDESSMTSTTVTPRQRKQTSTKIPPPPITASSSNQALQIGDDLQSLNAKMYGAYWCSHCYDQKQLLGREAFRNIEYVECSEDGLDNRRAVCQEKKIPGYPTWEIGGKMFPGELFLDEFEDIIQNIRSGQ